MDGFHPGSRPSAQAGLAALVAYRLQKKMVGTTRFELATSPTPNLDRTQSEQLGVFRQRVQVRTTTLSNAYWPQNGPEMDPRGGPWRL